MKNVKTENIVLDFTHHKAVENLTSNLPLAVMPQHLAMKLLKHYQESLERVDYRDIINDHIQDLRSAEGMNEAIDVSVSWLLERDLIKNVAKGNWEAYEVKDPSLETVVKAH